MKYIARYQGAEINLDEYEKKISIAGTLMCLFCIVLLCAIFMKNTGIIGLPVGLLAGIVCCVGGGRPTEQNTETFIWQKMVKKDE